MQKKLIGLVAISLTLLGVTSANASIIKLETGFSSAGSQASADDYKTVVNAAVASPGVGYGSALPVIYDNISNHSTIAGGVTNDIAFKSTIDFGLASASTFFIRAGVDFGLGGAIFVDGVAQDFKTTDMWWSGSYANPSQIFSISLPTLSAGNHTLNLYGLEHCCDGGQQVQWSFDGGEYTTFSTDDRLNPVAVPEPETYSMMLFGIGMMGFMARRRKKNQV